MAKKDKKKTAEHKARTAAKQTRKGDKKDKRHKLKNKDDDSDAEDVDLDALLAGYAEQQTKFMKITEVVSAPPTPRSSFTFLASPSGRNELFIFGGESYDGTIAKFFNNLFVYQVDKHEWHEVTSPNSPLPRSGHAWTRGGNTGGIYLFGGEFSSPKQGTFYHYNDLWHLDPTTREWTRIETKGKGPPARSGHRMTYFKGYIILFGGFQDTSQQTKYLQDLWIFDCQEYVWYNPAPPQKPDARSSFSLLPHDTGAVLFGGYSRVKVNAASSTNNKQQKVTPQRTGFKPVVHEDTWFLRITPPAADSRTPTEPTVRWERRKKPANAPRPPRAGVSMAYHKGRGILFGGVHDVETTEEGIDSEFFNDLLTWNTDRNRFFPTTLRRPKANNGGKKQGGQQQGARQRNRAKADEEELMANLARLELKASGNDVDLKDTINTDRPDTGGDNVEDHEKKDNGSQNLPVKFEMPHRRFNAQLAVLDDILFICGGTFERGDQEFTFNDMYSIDLGKLDGCKEIFFNEPENWNDAIPEESEDDEDDDDDEGYGDDEDEEHDQESEKSPIIASPDVANKAQQKQDQENKEEEEENEVETTDPKSTLPHPRPFEALRDFFSRTAVQWQEILLSRVENLDAITHSVKELRKEAFNLAETTWWDCREEIMALEDEQEAAGISEVVNIAEKSTGPAVGRRR